MMYSWPAVSEPASTLSQNSRVAERSVNCHVQLLVIAVDAPLRFEMADVAHFHQHLEGLPRRAEIAPRASYRLELGSLEVNRHATEFPLDISFSIDDRPQTWAVTLTPISAEP